MENKIPVKSSEVVAGIANNLGAGLQQGFSLKKEHIIDALKCISMFHYHGHAWYGTASPLDSALLLNQVAYAASCQANESTISLKGRNVETLTARDIIIRPQLNQTSTICHHCMRQWGHEDFKNR